MTRFRWLLAGLVLAALTVSASAETKKLKALIIDGQNNHNWKATTPVVKKILEDSGLFQVDVATAPAGKDLSEFKPKFSDYAVVVSNYNGAPWSKETQDAFVEYVKNGGGFVSVHAANNSFGTWAEYNEIIGLGGWGGRNEKSGPYVRIKDDKVVLDTLVGMEVGSVHETACGECLRLATALRGDGQTTDEERRRFAALVRNRPSESIEALFERVESMSPDTPGFAIASGLPVYFRYAINQVFSAIGWELRLDILTRFLTRQFEDDQSAHVFVSFNYDLALDRAVETASGREWQAQGGYGFEFPFFTVDGETAFSSVHLPNSSERFRILKPHGSLNWLRCRRNSAGQTDSGIDARDIVIPLNRDLELRYWPSSDPFHKISFPGGSPRDVEIMIAPPSPAKLSIMPPVCSAEFDAVSKADEVFVVGYSLPKTDQDQRNLIRDAVNARRTPVSKLTVINYNAPPAYIEDIRGLFQPRSIRTCNEGFVNFSARGSAFESALGTWRAFEPASCRSRRG